MNLPKSSFSNIAEESKLCLIINNKINVVKPVGESKNFFYLSGYSYHLQESGDLKDIERLYFLNNETKIKNLLNDLTLNDLENKTKAIEKDMYKLEKKCKIINFIIGNFFDFDNSISAIFDKDGKIKNSIKSKKQRISGILESKNNNNYDYEKFDNSFEFIINKNYSILEKDVIKNRNLMIFNNNVHKIKKISFSTYNKIRAKFKLNNEMYSYQFLFTLDDLEKEYSQGILNELKNISDYGKRKLSDKMNLLKQKKKVLEILKLNEYQYGKIGFLKEEDICYVFEEQEPFVLIDGNAENYYKFNKCKVGVGLTFKNKKINIDFPVMINSYTHPALPKLNEAKQYICFGNKDDPYFQKMVNDFDRRNDAVGKTKYFLKVGKNALTYGYRKTNETYHPLNQIKYAQNLITPEKAKKQGIPVVNSYAKQKRC